MTSTPRSSRRIPRLGWPSAWRLSHAERRWRSTPWSPCRHSAPMVEASDIERARGAIADVARRTPVLPSATLEERVGGDVVLKAESLQRTGSFKLRGALSKLAALGDGCAAGVVAGSAGNHAQALAAAARARRVP